MSNLERGLVEMRFATRNFYPIETICRLLKQQKDAEWYAVEENDILKSLEYPFYYDGITFDEFMEERTHYYQYMNSHPTEDYFPLYALKNEEGMQKWLKLSNAFPCNR